jgi:hypothetical protein
VLQLIVLAGARDISMSSASGKALTETTAEDFLTVNVEATFQIQERDRCVSSTSTHVHPLCGGSDMSSSLIPTR